MENSYYKTFKKKIKYYLLHYNVQLLREDDEFEILADAEEEYWIPKKMLRQDLIIIFVCRNKEVKEVFTCAHDYIYQSMLMFKGFFYSRKMNNLNKFITNQYE